MANATIKSKEVQTVISKTVNYVVLELDKDEANFLLEFLGKAGTGRLFNYFSYDTGYSDSLPDNTTIEKYNRLACSIYNPLESSKFQWK